MTEEKGYSIESRFDAGRSRIWLKIVNDNAADASLHAIRVIRSDSSSNKDLQAEVTPVWLLARENPGEQWIVPAKNQIECIVQAAPPGSTAASQASTNLAMFDPSVEIAVKVGTAFLTEPPTPGVTGFDDRDYVEVPFPQTLAKRAVEADATAKDTKKRQNAKGDLKLPAGSVPAPKWMVTLVSIAILSGLAFWKRDEILSNFGWGFGNQYPVLLSPDDGTSNPTAETPTLLTWQPVKGADDYVVEIEVLSPDNRFVRHPVSGRMVTKEAQVAVALGGYREVRWHVIARKRSRTGREQQSKSSAWSHLSQVINPDQH